jgi:hypothetical protein
MKFVCIAGLAACAAALVVACKARKRTESSYSCASSRELLVRIDVDETGGAAVSDETDVLVPLANSSDGSQRLIFKGSAMSAFAVHWRGDQEIHLSYPDGFVTQCDSGPAPIAGKIIRVVGCPLGRAQARFCT